MGIYVFITRSDRYKLYLICISVTTYNSIKFIGKIKISTYFFSACGLVLKKNADIELTVFYKLNFSKSCLTQNNSFIP